MEDLRSPDKSGLENAEGVVSRRSFGRGLKMDFLSSECHNPSSDNPSIK